MTRSGLPHGVIGSIVVLLLAATHAFPQQDKAEIEVFGLRPGGDTDERVLLRVRTEPTGRMAPLLPYIFFDDGSADVPARYLGADTDATADRFVRSYRAILSIIAERMTRWPMDTLVITGTRALTGVDRRRSDLGRRRAEAVATALTDRGADRRRMIVRGRALPASPSGGPGAARSAENRRVELSGSVRLLSPVLIPDPLLQAESPGIRLVPALEAPVSDSAAWRIELRHAGKLFRRLSGRFPMPESIDESFSLTEMRWFAESGVEAIDVAMVIKDGVDSIVARPRSIRIRMERQRRAPDDRLADRESIVLFGFDSSEPMPGSDALLEDLLQRIGPTAGLTLTGFTDETGPPEHNLELSRRRAAAVATKLGSRVRAARGAGGSGGLHWNSTPEDRFYSRVVRLSVE